MEHATRLGSRIRACRLAKGLSASALARRVGITENAIRKIESGDSKEPRFSTGVRIAAALGVSPSELVPADDTADAPPDLALTLRRIRACRAKLSKLGVAHVAVFGSVARGEATASSDIDVLVEPAAKRRFTLFDLTDAKEILQSAFDARLDVVTPATLERSPRGRAALEEAVRAF